MEHLEERGVGKKSQKLWLRKILQEGMSLMTQWEGIVMMMVLFLYEIKNNDYIIICIIFF